MTEELIKLTQKYYELISPDHHKDRDCHFYIQKTYSYGEAPYYRFEHYGYCNTIGAYLEDCEDCFTDNYQDEEFPRRKTEEEAERDMKEFLEWAIKQEEEELNK